MDSVPVLQLRCALQHLRHAAGVLLQPCHRGLALDASTEVHIRGAVLDAWGHLEGCQDGVESNEVLVLDLRKT